MPGCAHHQSVVKGDMKKYIYLFLIFIFISIPCQAQEEIYSIDDFSKMLQSHVSPYLLPKNAASEAWNVRTNSIYGSLAKRASVMEYGTLGAFSVTSLHRFYKSNDTEFLIGTGSSLILKGDDSGGAATTLRDQLTSGLRWTWVTYKDKAIGGNGTDRCQKWDGAVTTTADTDGARTANLLTTELGAPFAELDTGTDLDASSWYQYKVANYNGTTYSYSTARSNPILTGSSVYNIALTDIPLGESGATHRYIYRTLGGADRATVEADSTYYLVGTIADNVTQTLADDVTDATADDDAAPTWSTASSGVSVTPPIGKFLTLHKERLFIANAPSLDSYFYWGTVFKPDIFNSSDWDYVRVDDGDQITGQVEILGRLAYFKTNSITNFETQSSDDTKWQLYTFSFVGCPAPYSIAKSPSGIIYLGWDGLYIYNGEDSQLISDSVTPVVNDVLRSNLGNVAGSYFQNEYQMAYTSNESGETINNRVLLLDTGRESFVIDTKSVNCFEVFDSGNDYGTLYTGSSKSDGYVYSQNPSLSNLVLRYRSDFDAGTRDSIAVSGAENSPELELGWGIYINDASMDGVSLNSLAFADSTINRKSTTGYWWSPAIQVDASDYDKLYWNESLEANGDITFAIRSASSATDATADSLEWSSEFTDPSGSDMSGETANDFMQIRTTFTTTTIVESPVLDTVNNFTVEMVYSKVGSAAETEIASIWKSGYTDFGKPTFPKRITGMNLYYTGTLGILTVGIENGRGDIDTTFDIDLSVDPDDDTDDQYFGNSINKIYKWLPPINSEDDPSPVGRLWKFSVEENGATVWNVFKILTKYETEDFYDD